MVIAALCIIAKEWNILQVLQWVNKKKTVVHPCHGILLNSVK